MRKRCSFIKGQHSRVNRRIYRSSNHLGRVLLTARHAIFFVFAINMKKDYRRAVTQSYVALGLLYVHVSICMPPKNYQNKFKYNVSMCDEYATPLQDFQINENLKLTALQCTHESLPCI